MPIYEYGCEKCGQTFEYMQSVSDAPKTECEACGGALRKLISSTSFQLKGSGWYKDLYSSAKPGTGAGSSSGSSSSGESSTSKPSETKSKTTSSNKAKGGD